MPTNDMVKIDKTHAYKRVGNNSDVQTLNGIIKDVAHSYGGKNKVS